MSNSRLEWGTFWEVAGTQSTWVNTIQFNRQYYAIIAFSFSKCTRINFVYKYECIISQYKIAILFSSRIVSSRRVEKGTRMDWSNLTTDHNMHPTTLIWILFTYLLTWNQFVLTTIAESMFGIKTRRIQSLCSAVHCLTAMQCLTLASQRGIKYHHNTRQCSRKPVRKLQKCKK